MAFWIIQIVSTEECSSLMQNLMQICCSARSVILNVMATQYTCSLNGIYCPHWLAQWSCQCSHMCIPVHSPWLPGYMDVTQTILIILIMAGLFPDRPRIFDFSQVLLFVLENLALLLLFFRGVYSSWGKNLIQINTCHNNWSLKQYCKLLFFPAVNLIISQITTLWLTAFDIRMINKMVYYISLVNRKE